MEARTMPWLLFLLCVVATGGVLQSVAQPNSGFVTIDCGLPGETGYVDTNTMVQYTMDAGFIDTGINGNISSQYKGMSLSRYTVRSFPSGTRNCYTIGSLVSRLKYLIRAKFLYGNYDALNRLPIMFDLYVGVNFWTTVNVSRDDYTFTMEAIVVVPDDFVQVCLVNTGFGTPFINGLDLRPLKNTLYPYANETNGLFLVQRFNFGPSDPNTFFRYPADPHDRWWWPFVNVTADWAEIKTDLEVEGSAMYETPTAVMQTAITPRNARNNIEFSLDLPTSLNHTSLSYVSIMHFSELNLVPSNASRQYAMHQRQRPAVVPSLHAKLPQERRPPLPNPNQRQPIPRLHRRSC